MIHLSDLAPSEYAGYFNRYVDYVKSSETIDGALEASALAIGRYYQQLPLSEQTKAYAPGKWTPKQILRHLIDTERVMAYRALRFSRGDKTPLAGFEQDEYVFNSHANQESLEELLREYRVVRESSRLLFDSLSEQEGSRMGTASNMSLSARAFAFMLAGHDRHHLKILNERYFEPLD